MYSICLSLSYFFVKGWAPLEAHNQMEMILLIRQNKKTTFLLFLSWLWICCIKGQNHLAEICSYELQGTGQQVQHVAEYWCHTVWRKCMRCWKTFFTTVWKTVVIVSVDIRLGPLASVLLTTKKYLKIGCSGRVLPGRHVELRWTRISIELIS